MRGRWPGASGTKRISQLLRTGGPFCVLSMAVIPKRYSICNQLIDATITISCGTSKECSAVWICQSSLISVSEEGLVSTPYRCNVSYTNVSAAAHITVLTTCTCSEEERSGKAIWCSIHSFTPRHEGRHGKRGLLLVRVFTFVTVSYQHVDDISTIRRTLANVRRLWKGVG